MKKALPRLAINLTGADAALANKVKALCEKRMGTTLSAVQIGAIAFKALAEKEAEK
jgi:hypothetical protein